MLNDKSETHFILGKSSNNHSHARKLSAGRQTMFVVIRCLFILMFGVIAASGTLWKIESSQARPVPPGDTGGGTGSTDDGSSYTPSLDNIEASSYNYVTGVTGAVTATSGLPVVLDAYLNHKHDVWVLAESYSQNVVHESLMPEVGMEAMKLLQDKKINWNANQASKQLFLRLNGPATQYAAMVMGMSAFRNETPIEVELHFQGLIEESAQALEKGGEIVTGEEGQVIFKGKSFLACSFTANTPVTTVQGKQSISTLHIGDRVLAYNPKTHKTEPQSILHVWVHSDADLVNLAITTVLSKRYNKAVPQTTEIVHTNQRHPFLTVEQGFLPVSEITPGMHIVQADGRSGIVTGRKVEPGTATMYNLELARVHTFMVGEGQWIVHNECSNLRDGTPVSLSEDRLDHSFNSVSQKSGLSHAQEWFGRPVTNADKQSWKNLINSAMKSKQVFPWSLKGTQTVAVLARFPYSNEMRYFVVQFYQDTGELATAFRPTPDQLNRMFELLKISGK